MIRFDRLAPAGPTVDTYVRTHLDDNSLEQSFNAHATIERAAIASLLADIAEIDIRHLFLRAGFESMRAYCVEKLHLSEDAAAKRIQLARLARELPALYPAIADGRLRMTAVLVLSARLTPLNVEEWIAVGANRTVAQIEVLIAHRHPQPEKLRLDDGIDAQVIARQSFGDTLPQLVAQQSYHEIGPQVVVPQSLGEKAHAAKRADLPTPVAPRVRARITPLSSDRYNITLSFDAAAHAKLRRAQEMLGHVVPSGNPSKVVELALDVLLSERGKRKFGLETRFRAPRAAGARRSIPAQTRNAVYRRDQGRCAFIDREGRGCGSTRRLEFDHVIPLAHGGKTTIENLRLLCRAHNQYEAERVFGRELVEEKRRSRTAQRP